MVRSAALLVGAVLLAPPLLTAQPLSVEVAIAPSATIHAGNPLTIHVTATNNGAQTANDVRVHVMFPVFLQFLGVSAPAEWNAHYQEVIHGQHQLFAGLSTLPPGGSVTITVEARAPETLWPGSTAPIRGSTAMPGTSLVEQRTDVTIFGAAPIPATASGLSPVGPGTVCRTSTSKMRPTTRFTISIWSADPWEPSRTAVCSCRPSAPAKGPWSRGWNSPTSTSHPP